MADADGAPTAGATVQVWQTASNQLYDVQDDTQPRGHLRATFITDECGAYAFRTILPVSYPIPTDGPAGQFLQSLGRHPFRPARGHFLISAPRVPDPGHAPLPGRRQVPRERRRLRSRPSS